MSEYVPTIGLEIHAELKTRTKMFCDSKNDPDETRPNVNVCPVCMAHPGTLPVINKEAVRHIIRMGVALGGRIADFTEFDRKNYFYPDIPKGYQISQYKYPLISGGSLRGVAITRIHLEEDTARSQHEGDRSLVDFNRAGLPLMELVTEPVMHTAEDAGDFARELQLLLRYLGAGEANMEKGQMRVEANISVRKKSEGSSQTLGTKVEVKNLNSFRSVERAIEFEVRRQIKLLEEGGKVIQETRGWDEAKQATFSQRLKESSHDYRYFPDPDLPKLHLAEIPEFGEEAVRASLPELPWERRARYLGMTLKEEDADMFVKEPALGGFFDRAASEAADPLLTANYLASDVAGMLVAGKIGLDVLAKPETATSFADLMNMLAAGTISSRAAKDILPRVLQGEDPETLAEGEGLLQKNDKEELLAIVHAVIENNPKVVLDYKTGKEAALQYLVGQGMKATKGSANPGVLREVFIEVISS